jgi:putative ABC transport system permease protein
MGNKLLPTALLVAGNAQGASILPGVENVQNKEALMNSFNSMLNSMQTIIAILILAAVILGFVVLYNLGALSLTERTRELATLKVLGFPNKKIQLLLQKQNIWLTVLGILLGIPAGYIFIGYMLSTISDSSDYITHVSLQTLTICIVSTFLLSLTVNFIMSRKVKTIDMVSSLKSVE